MDKEVVENYGWIVIVLILGLTITLISSPLSNYLYASIKMGVVEEAIEDKGLFDKNNNSNTEDVVNQIKINFVTDDTMTWEGGYIDTFVAGKETVLPTNITKKNYQFAGWYQTEELTPNSYIEKIPTTQLADLTLYPKWISEKYIISYDLAGGEFVSSPVFYYNYSSTKNITPPTVKREGYTFSHWTIKIGNSETEFDSNFGYSGNATLCANWTKV